MTGTSREESWTAASAITANAELRSKNCHPSGWLFFYRMYVCLHIAINAKTAMSTKKLVELLKNLGFRLAKKRGAALD